MQHTHIEAAQLRAKTLKGTLKRFIVLMLKKFALTTLSSFKQYETKWMLFEIQSNLVRVIILPNFSLRCSYKFVKHNPLTVYHKCEFKCQETKISISVQNVSVRNVDIQLSSLFLRKSPFRQEKQLSIVTFRRVGLVKELL